MTRSDTDQDPTRPVVERLAHAVDDYAHNGLQFYDLGDNRPIIWYAGTYYRATLQPVSNIDQANLELSTKHPKPTDLPRDALDRLYRAQSTLGSATWFNRVTCPDHLTEAFLELQQDLVRLTRAVGRSMPHDDDPDDEDEDPDGSHEQADDDEDGLLGRLAKHQDQLVDQFNIFKPR